MGNLFQNKHFSLADLIAEEFSQRRTVFSKREQSFKKDSNTLISVFFSTYLLECRQNTAVHDLQ